MSKPRIRKMICKYGHNISIVGRNKSGACNECYRADYRRPEKREQARKHGWKVDGILNDDGAVFSHNDFNRLFQIQGGKCKMCGIHQSALNRALCVDHDRATGRARGLLCMVCNRNMVGKHTLETALDLVKYLSNDLQKAMIQDATATLSIGNGHRDATATEMLAGNELSSTEEISRKVV